MSSPILENLEDALRLLALVEETREREDDRVVTADDPLIQTLVTGNIRRAGRKAVAHE